MRKRHYWPEATQAFEGETIRHCRAMETALLGRRPARRKRERGGTDAVLEAGDQSDEQSKVEQSRCAETSSQCLLVS